MGIFGYGIEGGTRFSYRSSHGLSYQSAASSAAPDHLFRFRAMYSARVEMVIKTFSPNSRLKISTP